MKPSLLIIFLLAFGTAFPQGRQSTINVHIDGIATRPALLYLPDDYPQSATNYPLILFLHDYSESGSAPDLSKIYDNKKAGGPAAIIAANQWPAGFANPADGKQYKFIILSPQSENYSISQKQIPFILNDLMKMYKIDTGRIYFTGIGAGAESIVNYAAQIGVGPRYKPAAILPMSATTNTPQRAWAEIIVSDSVHVWGFGSDPADLFGITTHTLLNHIIRIQPQFGRFTNFNGGHCCWNNFYNPDYKEIINGRSMNIYEWMLQYRQSVAATAPVIPEIDTTDIIVTAPLPAKTYILKADAQGYLIIDNTNGLYKPGDTILLSGYFKAVAVTNLSGNAKNYINISNVPGETLVIGDSTWHGGSWAHGLAFGNCHFIKVGGSTKYKFKITGSNSVAQDRNGYPVRTAYFDLAISDLSDNFIVHDIMIRHGGSGVFAKTEVSPAKNATWYPNTWLKNFEFYNLDIYNTYNEAMYIGHTASYWDIRTNTPYYPGPNDPVPEAILYKRPIKLRNVKIHHNYIHDIGNDAIQTAAIDGLEIYNNEITNWATKHGMADNGGILIGGRVKGFNVYNNYVHDGWGELMQIYAEGGATSNITNNLLVRNKLDGVSIRGTNNLTVAFSNNTVAYVGGNLIRINGYYGGTGQNMIKKNILAQPQMNGGAIYPQHYIYLENGGNAVEGVAPNDNRKFASGGEANWNERGYFRPNLGSWASGYGYTRK